MSENFDNLTRKFAQRMLSADTQSWMQEDYERELRLFAIDIVNLFIESVRKAFKSFFEGG